MEVIILKRVKDRKRKDVADSIRTSVKVVLDDLINVFAYTNIPFYKFTYS